MKNEPIRLQKYLSESGYCSRRKAEELIEAGKVKVNGHPAKLGDKVRLRGDIVTVRGEKIIRKDNARVYLMLHKPRGFVSTMQDELGRKCVADLVHDAPAKVFPAGRLDKDSEGLLLFSSDGEFVNMMTHPSRHVEKRYRVTVRPPVTDEQLLNLEQGVLIDGRKTHPCEVNTIVEEDNRVVLEFVLHEGRNRQIRKMCEAVGLNLIRLKRFAIGNLKLGMLPQGKWRLLNDREVRDLIALAKGQEPTKK
ncbi:MAG: rRNA pseudouridine synthase [Clostridia bacterium]|nr:rRNA pseudouridine synthase [Clostridia bacterium]